MSAQKPSVGRIVHFHFRLSGQQALVTRPAVIVRVWSKDDSPSYDSDEVNLLVFLDGGNDGVVHGQPNTRWETSVRRRDEPEAGCWSWPPFVGPR